MTVTAETPRAQHTGDSVQVTFTYSFRLDSASHIRVYLNDALQTQGPDYTVDSFGQSGGSITFSTAPQTGATIRIERETPLDQQTDYVTNDPFPADSHEQALDKLTMIAQDATLQAGGSGGFDPSLNYTTTGNWLNGGDWSFTGQLLFEGVRVAKVTEIPDVSGYTLRNAAETITAAWNFTGGAVINGSTWPADLGTDGFVLKTDGAGNLAWVAQSGGAGFDPSANYTVTGQWTFSNWARFNTAAYLGNAAPLQARNNADTNFATVAVMTTADRLQLGTNSGVTEGTDILTPPGKPGRFFDDVNQVAEWTSRALGSLLVTLANAKVFKVGLRNPKTNRTFGTNNTLAQNDEGQICKAVTSGIALTVPNLEDGTCITIKNTSGGDVTLVPDAGITLKAFLGGTSITGTLTVARDSVVQLNWDNATGNIVDAWGNGIS